MPSVIGLVFIALGAFFYALRYLCAAVMYAGESSRSFTSFGGKYYEVGPDLTYTAILFFALGAGFLLFPLYQKLDQLSMDGKFPFSGNSGELD